jgi:hypothetical protein
MLRISTLSRLLALCAVLPAASQAQTTTQATPQAVGAPPATSGTAIVTATTTTTTRVAPSAAPPNIIGDDSMAPAVKIPPKRRDRKIVEKREGGRTTEVQVTTGGSSYILKPNTQPGSLPGDNVRGAMRPPQWVVKEFNLGEKKVPDNDNAGGQVAKPSGDAPPPPQIVPIEKK